MKKLFIQLLQWIFKYRKKLIYGIFALFVGQICFFNVGGIGVQNQVFATSTENAEQRNEFENIVTEKLKLVDFFRKAVYVLVYPVIFLAGKLVDNSFVYGEVFEFDVVLWKLWNIVRNLANYGLGFIFLYYIFRYLMGKDRQNHDPKRLIKRALIAGIGIQASWFIMAVLLDISTILIYSVGGLPISILGGGSSGSASEIIENGDQDYDPYITKTIFSVDADDIVNLNVFLTNIREDGNIIYISECDTFSFKYASGQKLNEEFILAPKLIYYQDGKGINHPTQKLMCDYFGSVYWFDGDLYEGILWPGECSSDKDCHDKQMDYDDSKNKVKNIIMSNSKIDTDKGNGKILRIGEVVDDKNNVGLDMNNRWMSDKYGTQQLHELVKRQDTKSYVGVFTTLYTSLMEAGRGMLPVGGRSIYVQFLGGLVALGHVLAISIPLIAALFVLIMRIGIIWMAVVLSPMIVLITAFEFDKNFKNGVLEYLKIKNLIEIIFAPVVICFAISMSTVLVRIIEKISFDETVMKPLVFGGLIQMDLQGFSVGLGKLIVGVMGIAVSWFLVWMAVESSKLGKIGFIKDLKDLATQGLGSIPIVPIMGKDGQGQLASVNALRNVYEDKKSEVLKEFRDGDTKAVNELFNRSEEEKKAIDRGREVAEINTVQTFVDGLKTQTIGREWMSNEVEVMIDGKPERKSFNSFEGSQKKKIIEKINGLSGDMLKKFGDATPDISFEVNGENVKYKFTEGKFKEQ